MLDTVIHALLDFIGKHSMLRQKLSDAATDALRLMRMELYGYAVDSLELIDPDDTPKNVLLRGIKKRTVRSDAESTIILTLIVVLLYLLSYW